MKIVILTTDNRSQCQDWENPQPWFGTAPEALLQGFERRPEHEIHVVSCIRRPMNSPRKLARNIWFHPVHVPKIGWMRTLYQGCVLAVRRKLREIQPDIVHGQGTELDCAMEAVWSGFPNVVTIHGNMKEIAQVERARFGSFYWWASRLETYALGRTGGVLCNSAHTESLVKPRARHTWRVPNALRLPFLEIPQSQQDRESRVLLNVGAVSSNKQQRELLRLAGQLFQEGCGLQVWFVGSAHPGNPYAAAFLQEVSQAEKKGYARYLGKKSVAELIELYDRTGGLVHTSQAESFGLVAAEALCRNARLFGFATGGVVDIAMGLTAVDLCTTGDWNGLRSMLVSWWEKACLTGPPSADVVRSRYHPERIAQIHLEIYREMLGKNHDD